MLRSRSVLAVISIYTWLLALAGCSIHKYHAVPVSTADSFAGFEARSLSADDLREFIRSNAHSDLP